MTHSDRDEPVIHHDRENVTHRILVPLELPDAEPVSQVLVEDLATLDIVVLGHYGLPEQTPTDAARAQFGDDAHRELDQLAQPFRDLGATVTTRIVFGKDRAKTIDRVAIEEDCTAELDPAPVDRIDRILVPLLDTANLPQLADFVAALIDETTNEILLFHVAEGDETAAHAEAMLEDARDALLDRGFDPYLVHVSVVDANDHDAEILQMAADFDVVVMDEADPTIPERIFGTLSDKIAKRYGDPVIVVRRNV